MTDEAAQPETPGADPAGHTPAGSAEFEAAHPTAPMSGPAGGAAPEAGVPEPMPAVPGPAPVVAGSSGRQGAFWLALLLAAAVAFGGAAFAAGAVRAAALPETVVLDYFAALQRGDAAAALGYGALPPGRHDLLTDQALAAQSAVAPIGPVEVIATDRHGDTATVGVHYTLALPSGPENVVDGIPVVRSGTGWRLVRSAVPVTLSPGDGSGRGSVVGSALPGGEFALFPGAMPVAYDTPDLDLAPAARVVRFLGDPSVRLDAEVSATGRAAIVPVLAAALSSCLAGKSGTQPLCPLPDSVAGVPGSLRGTGGRLDPTSLSLQVNGPTGAIIVSGRALLTGSYQDLDANDLPATAKVTSVAVHATCPAGSPGALVWSTP
jgi:hypothetical protein